MSIRNRGLVRLATEKSGVEYRPIFISVLAWQSEYPAYWNLRGGEWNGEGYSWSS